MFEHRQIQSLNDYFTELRDRHGNRVYFYRINGYSDEVSDFVVRYYDAARKSGVVIEGKIPNPDEKNLSYYSEIMGMGFQMSVGFFDASLKKWLPRMNGGPRQNVAAAVYDSLDSMRRAGKTENMLRNAYIKFMCWLYYKFERIVNQLGENRLPKLLYEGQISNYELMLISILSNAGCDVVLLQYQGDEAYLRLDPDSSRSDAYTADGLGPFPPDFSLRRLREEMRARADRERLYGTLPSISGCTNAWIKGTGLEDYRQSAAERGNDPKLYYNCFCRIEGVWDKLTYTSELYRFQSRLREEGRRLVIIDGEIPKPTPEEIAGVRRRNYQRADQMILDLSANIRHPANLELQRIMNKAFVDVMLMEAEKGTPRSGVQGSGEVSGGSGRGGVQGSGEVSRGSGQRGVQGSGELPGGSGRGGVQGRGGLSGGSGRGVGGPANVNRLTGKAVYLLCWLKRYQGQLFSGWKAPEISCLIHMGGCRSEEEALFVRFLARLPVDVLILCPDLHASCVLSDPLLYELRYAESLTLERFPQNESQVRIGTVAYHAERELDSLMYQDSGIYRNRQYAKANTVNLQTMYEEIPILWDQELKYRPNFAAEGEAVTLPVIFAKVSGVRDGDVSAYWQSVRTLVTEDTLFIREAPWIAPNAENPMKAFSTEFFRNGKLQRKKLKEHKNYPYAFLREEIQDYMLDKLQRLIDQKLIRGTFENGTEYTVVATVLNLPKEVVRMIQRFDFTKKNPKLVYVNATETMLSLEDSVLVAFLNLVGFDILFFIPTGYQNVEKHFNMRIMEEHQIGEYLYDLHVPELGRLPSGTGRTSWLDRLFRRGN